MSINIELLNKIKNQNNNDPQIIKRLNNYVNDPNLYDALIEIGKRMGSEITINHYFDFILRLQISPETKSIKIEILTSMCFIKENLGCFKYNYDTKTFELELKGNDIEKHYNLMQINLLFFNYNENIIYNEINKLLTELV